MVTPARRRDRAPVACFVSRLRVRCLLLLVAAAGPAAAQDTGRPDAGIASLDIEELARIKVTSVARLPEPFTEAAAAVSVITREDIRRSGATTLAEALRLVPGLQTARLGSRDWAVSARGFNDQNTNKLLVLVDGRAVYSPFFAGVFWDVQHVSLADVERIEVIRGPGATLWGANAVNGVINVTTRSSTETQGGLASARVGTAGGWTGLGRYGLGLGRSGTMRVYARGIREPSVELEDGSEAPEDWTLGQAGFRADWSGGRRAYTLQGDVYRGEGEQRYQLVTEAPPHLGTFDLEAEAEGFNLLGRVSGAVGARSDYTLQAYYDQAIRRQPGFFGRVAVHTVDLDFQYHAPIGRRHDLLVGAGYRRVSDDVGGSFILRFDPARRTTDLFTVFLQNHIDVVPERVALILGTKVEHNGYSGVEVQPNVRMLWNVAPSHALWAAVSGSARSPARADVDVIATGAVIDGTPRTFVQAQGSESFRSERLIAYEAGYRATPDPRLSLDVAAYYNDYQHLRSVVPQAPVVSDTLIVLPLVIRNDFRGRTYGGEVSVTVGAARGWRLRANYALLEMKVEPRSDAPAGAATDVLPGLNPTHQASLWSSFDLPHEIELDVVGRYVSELEAPASPVSDYLTADAKVTWRVTPMLRAGLLGQDLLQPRHAEFRPPQGVVGQRRIPRRVSAFVSWRF
jgi:iron complex outermembrane receptor protein